jgi:hypothetical protein
MKRKEKEALCCLHEAKWVEWGAQASKKSDHGESAHNVQSTVDKTEVTHVLADHWQTDSRSWQRALPTAGMVWE